MRELSIYPPEEDVLFFPFSSFIIKDIKEIFINGKKIHEIYLFYLGNDINKTDDINNKNKESIEIDFYKIDEDKNINRENISQIEELKKQLNDEKNKKKIII